LVARQIALRVSSIRYGLTDKELPAQLWEKLVVAPILLGVALSLVIDVAAAEVASDNELYAAYCIGVLQDKQQAQRKALARSRRMVSRAGEKLPVRGPSASRKKVQQDQRLPQLLQS
jgi:hypothetical protein